MRVPRYFNKDIRPNCEYCANCQIDDKQIYICTLNRSIKDEKCPKFVYDPLMRVPDAMPEMPKFEEDDFKI